MLELAKIQQQNYIGIHHGTTRLVAQYVEADLNVKSGYCNIGPKFPQFEILET